jgi:hypothetical protein
VEQLHRSGEGLRSSASLFLVLVQHRLGSLHCEQAEKDNPGERRSIFIQVLIPDPLYSLPGASGLLLILRLGVQIDQHNHFN